jgi:hypothetical protein
VDCGSEPGRSPCGREGNRAGLSSPFHDTLGDPLAFTRLLRIATVGLIFGLGLVVVPTTATAARADPIGNCTTTAGTIVAVDFSHWGGPIVRGCGVDNPSGYALLHAAGFSTAGDAHDGPAFACRIGNEAFQHGTQYPTPAQDACVLTPPTAAYWSYWLAPAGQNRWTYSPRGPTSDVPKAGAVELWIFGSTNIGGTTGSGVPSFSPDGVRAHNATPTAANPPTTPTTRRPAPVTNPGPAGVATRPLSTAATGNGASRGTSSRPGDPVASGPGKATGAPTTTGARNGISPSTASTTRGSSDSSDPPRIVAALPAVPEHESSGSIAPLLVGIGLVAVLGGGTAGSMLRRRHRRE